MLGKIIKWSQKIIDELIPGKVGQTNLGSTISPAMARAIESWEALYNNSPLWVSKKESVFTMGLPGAIASELARLVTIEMKSEITGSVRGDFLNAQYQKVLEDIRSYLEYGCAKGGLIIKPYFDGRGISIDYIQPDVFLPVAFDSSGKITAAVMVDTKRRGDITYRRFEGHTITNLGYVVINRAYASKNDGILGNEVSLDTLEDWSAIEPERLLPGITEPLFGYFKVPSANRVDNTSPLGVSVFASANEAMMFEIADRQYSRIIQEYELKEPAIFVAESMLKNDGFGGVILPNGKEKVYRTLDVQGGINSKEFFEEFSPEIRDSSLFNGLNKYLQRIEFECGLAYGTLSDMQTVEKTATEIKTSKQRSYSTVSDIQKSLKIALEDLIKAMDVMADEFNLSPKGEYNVSFHFDDSIVVDSETERNVRLQEVSAGILRPELYLMWRYGVTEAQALKMMPDTEEVLDDSMPVSDPNKGGNTKVGNTEEIKTAEEIAGKSLNGAQTQSLLGIIGQYSKNELTTGQAINLISVAIGISKDEAKKILEGAD